MSDFFDNKEEAVNFIINLNRKFFLDNKDYIQKYYKIRNIHSIVLKNMMNYIDSGKLPVEEYFSMIGNDLIKETNGLKFMLDNQNCDDVKIFNELFIYKNNDKIPSLTEIYIDKKKFKDEEKIKMLYAMRDSVVGLFKIIGFDHVNGYLTYEDVFTHKKYKIIDISMSSMEELYKDFELYIYDRIINYDGILFGTGLPCIFNSKCKKLMEFIKNHKYNKCCNFSRCIILYGISKSKENNIKMKNYISY